MRWQPKPAGTKNSATAADAAGTRFEHIQSFFDTTRGQITIGEIPPIPRAALAAVGGWLHEGLRGVPARLPAGEFPAPMVDENNIGT